MSSGLKCTHKRCASLGCNAGEVRLYSASSSEKHFFSVIHSKCLNSLRHTRRYHTQDKSCWPSPHTYRTSWGMRRRVQEPRVKGPRGPHLVLVICSRWLINGEKSRLLAAIFATSPWSYLTFWRTGLHPGNDGLRTMTNAGKLLSLQKQFYNPRIKL